MQNASKDSNLDLMSRLGFMGLGAFELERIRKVKGVIDRELPVALDRFYEQVASTPQVQSIFKDAQHVGRAKHAQVGHWGAISSARFDEKYAANVRRIGLTHARIGLEPRWYIGGYALVVEHLISSIVAATCEGEKAGELSATLSAFVKAVLLDMDLAISVYIDAAEEARIAAEAAATARERELVANSVGHALSQLADKNLAFRMNFDLPNAYQGLQTDFNEAIGHLEQALKNVWAATQAITVGSQELANASENLAARTEVQAANLEETSAAMNELSSVVNSTATSASKTKDVISSAKIEAEASAAVVKRTIGAIHEIRNSSQQISQIVSVIDEIALQTNLLALNAGVEAARAGEAGRGFAVVASEVRALARRSAESAKEIKSLVGKANAEVASGVKLAGETELAINRIMSQVTLIDGGIAQIATRALDQAATLKQVNTAISEIDQTTQQNAAMAEQATAACQALVCESDQLMAMVGEFNIGRMQSQAPRRFAAAGRTRLR